MMNPDKILKASRITEKAGSLSSNHNQYSFEVYPEAHKGQIARAVENVFAVKVIRVNTLRYKGKIKQDRARRGRPGIKNAHKRALVTLKQGDTIELL